MRRKLMVSVIGGHNCSEPCSEEAEEAGSIIAKSGAVLVCGGLGGVMEAACRGAKLAGGITIGILPGEEHSEANGYVDIVIPTGMGFSRNTLVAGCPDMVLALKGAYGTLSEICFALVGDVPVYSTGSWDIPEIHELSSLAELALVIEKIRSEKKL